MELIFVRHGDPDYVHDSLTDRGWKEAQALVDRFRDLDVKQYFVSPLGRAKDTASFTLKETGRTAIEYDWLREFPAKVNITDCRELLDAYPDHKVIDGQIYANTSWDILPGYWATHPEYLHPTDWKNSLIVRKGDFLEQYNYVTSNFDRLLAEYGYERDGQIYLARHSNRDKLVFFCHYGVTSLLLSYLYGVSPFILWHSLSFAPSSVTTVFTEERREGIAYFRTNKIGDISHLYKKGIEPSFACRFCETYDSFDERH